MATIEYSKLLEKCNYLSERMIDSLKTWIASPRKKNSEIVYVCHIILEQLAITHSLEEFKKFIKISEHILDDYFIETLNLLIVVNDTEIVKYFVLNAFTPYTRLNRYLCLIPCIENKNFELLEWLVCNEDINHILQKFCDTGSSYRLLHKIIMPCLRYNENVQKDVHLTNAIKQLFNLHYMNKKIEYIFSIDPDLDNDCTDCTIL